MEQKQGSRVTVVEIDQSLTDDLLLELDQLPTQVECPKDGGQLGLNTHPYVWTIGMQEFRFAKLPNYHCPKHNITLHPDQVISRMRELIEPILVKT